MCTGCQSSYYHVGGQCFPCSSYFWWFLPLIDTFVVIGVLGYFWWDHKVHIKESKNKREVVGIILFWMQLLGILNDTQILEEKTDPVNLGFTWFERILAIRPQAFECVMSSYNYFSSFWLLWLFPFVLVVISFILTTVLNCFNRTNFITRILSVRNYLLILAFFPLASSCLQVLNCVSVEGSVTKYINNAPWISCDDSRYRYIYVAALIHLCVVIPGIPLYFFIAWKRSHFEHHPEFNFLHNSRTNQWWWMFILSRSFVFAVILSLTPYRSIFIPVGVLLVVIVSSLFSVLVSPYQHASDRWLEIILLIEATISFIGGLLQGTASFTGSVTWVITSFHVVALIGAIYVWSPISGYRKLRDEDKFSDELSDLSAELLPEAERDLN